MRPFKGPKPKGHMAGGLLIESPYQSKKYVPLLTILKIEKWPHVSKTYYIGTK